MREFWVTTVANRRRKISGRYRKIRDEKIGRPYMGLLEKNELIAETS